MSSVRPSVPTFKNLAKQNKVKTMIATGETVGLAEWIIDDKCRIVLCITCAFVYFQFPSESLQILRMVTDNENGTLI